MACSKTKLPAPKGGKKTSLVQIFLDLTLLNIFEANLPDLTHEHRAKERPPGKVCHCRKKHEIHWHKGETQVPAPH